MRTLILIFTLVGLLFSFPAAASDLEAGDVIKVQGYCNIEGAAMLEATAKEDVKKAKALVNFYMEQGICQNSATNGRPFVVGLRQVVSTFADAEKDVFEVWEINVFGVPGVYYILNRLENVL
tara:strand:+ start:193 stop:558 length:366 start_codon:yes stop_codon:yes gene_type:complete